MLGKILIVGAGAIGSVLGGFLRQAGENVTLLGRKNHIEKISQNGLKITGVLGDYRVTGFYLATDFSELSEKFDLVFLSVKTYDTNSAMAGLAPLLKSKSLVVVTQNGLGNLETVADIIGKERTVGSRVIFGAEVVSPGWVRVTVYADQLIIGGFDREVSRKLKDQINLIAKVFNQAGIPCTWVEDIHPYLWAKVLYNCQLNPLASLLNVEYGTVGDDSELRSVMSEVVKEVFAVAKAEGVPLFWKNPEEYEQEFFEKLLPSTRAHRPSMLGDFNKGKPTEIDALNGMIVKLAKKHGISTPYNEVLTRLVRARARLGQENR